MWALVKLQVPKLQEFHSLQALHICDFFFLQGYRSIDSILNLYPCQVLLFRRLLSLQSLQGTYLHRSLSAAHAALRGRGGTRTRIGTVMNAVIAIVTVDAVEAMNS